MHTDCICNEAKASAVIISALKEYVSIHEEDIYEQVSMSLKETC